MSAQTSENNFQIFTAAGKPAALEDIVQAMRAADVVFVGEIHNDPAAHVVEARLLQGAYQEYSGAAGKTPARVVALSMEMFERDVQPVLDEYLGGLIVERQFLLSSRPWENYQTAYRPLIEFAREHKTPVIAANAPERYVNRVGRLGRDSVKELSPTAKNWIAPAPYGTASPAYAAKFGEVMGAGMAGHSGHTGGHLLDAQVLRDVTMAYSIAEFLKRQPNALVIQINGGFHSEGRLGTPEQLLSYRPQARILVVTIVPGGAPQNSNPDRFRQLGDYVILTETSPSRSF